MAYSTHGYVTAPESREKIGLSLRMRVIRRTTAAVVATAVAGIIVTVTRILVVPVSSRTTNNTGKQEADRRKENILIWASPIGKERGRYLNHFGSSSRDVASILIYRYYYCCCCCWSQSPWWRYPYNYRTTLRYRHSIATTTTTITTVMTTGHMSLKY